MYLLGVTVQYCAIFTPARKSELPTLLTSYQHMLDRHFIVSLG